MGKSHDFPVSDFTKYKVVDKEQASKEDMLPSPILTPIPQSNLPFDNELQHYQQNVNNLIISRLSSRDDKQYHHAKKTESQHVQPYHYHSELSQVNGDGRPMELMSPSTHSRKGKRHNAAAPPNAANSALHGSSQFPAGNYHQA